MYRNPTPTSENGAYFLKSLIFFQSCGSYLIFTDPDLVSSLISDLDPDMGPDPELGQACSQKCILTTNLSVVVLQVVTIICSSRLNTVLYTPVIIYILKSLKASQF